MKSYNLNLTNWNGHKVCAKLNLCMETKLKNVCDQNLQKYEHFNKVYGIFDISRSVSFNI